MGGTVAGVDGTKIGGTLFFGSVSGGFGAVLTNGNFWQGAATGLIVSGLNHVVHRIAYPFNNKSTIDIENNNENTDPPYKYNNKTYESKEELYGAILLDQASEQLGIKDVVSLAAALDFTFPSIDKPFIIEESSSKTSYASKYGSKIFPQKMSQRLPTHIRGGSLRYTKVLGKFLGRVVGPIGWGVLTYDIGKTLYNTQVIYNRITTNQQ
ncbi:hypothetical protein Ga0061079_105133 [Apibacter mensalis]|uniref:Uncharacterized protein n=1 Tax=Apibacter mensalis TaxID=1586267 RepID=A0A0X3AP85_9FLAO|nr:hypothetical protein [Apibacter mensalis]CVK16174.1 hypothetical protein Ga0061079_105133 [Apibacter mensalis]